MSPVNSMFVCIKKKKKKKKLSANLFLKWPISIIGKMLNIGADNRSTPTEKGTSEESKPAMEEWSLVIVNSQTDYLIQIYMVKHSMIVLIYCSLD